MILTCPECETRFELPDAALGPDGRRVRCSNCRHVWKAHPDDAATASPSDTAPDVASDTPPEKAPDNDNPSPAIPVADPSRGRFEGEDFDVNDPPGGHWGEEPDPDPVPEEDATAASIDEEGEPEPEDSWVTATDRILAEHQHDSPAPASDAPAAPPPGDDDGASDLLELLGNKPQKPKRTGSRAATAKPTSAKPTGARNNRVGWIALALVAVMVPTLFILMRAPIAEVWPAARVLYQRLGLQVEDPLVALIKARSRVGVDADSVRWESTPEGNRLHSRARVTNRGAEAIDLPVIVGTLKADGGVDVEQWEITPDPAPIASGQTREFDSSVLVTALPNSRNLQIEYRLRWPEPTITGR